MKLYEGMFCERCHKRTFYEEISTVGQLKMSCFLKCDYAEVGRIKPGSEAKRFLENWVPCPGKRGNRRWAGRHGGYGISTNYRHNRSSE